MTRRAWQVFLVAFPFIDIFLFRYTFILFPGPLGYGPFICMYALLPFFILKFRFPVRIAAILILTGLLGSTGWMNGIVTPSEFVKVFGSLVLPYTYYWYLWQHLGEDVFTAFRIYLKGAVVLSIFGLLTYVDSMLSLGFHDFANRFIHFNKVQASTGIRVIATLGEPTYFATTICPAGFFALYSLFFREENVSAHLTERGLKLSRKESIAILGALTLTFSAVAFVGFALSIVFHFLIKRNAKALLLIPMVVGGLYTIAESIPEINARISGLQNTDVISEGDVHGSSAILYNHAIITWRNFKENPIFGSGLGSHVAATEKYSILRDNDALFSYADQNAQDASSMLLRIVSELGVFGLLLTGLFIWRNYFTAIPGNAQQVALKFISSAFLISILLQLFRQGNFILNGFPFFVYGYFFCRKTFDQQG